MLVLVLVLVLLMHGWRQVLDLVMMALDVVLANLELRATCLLVASASVHASIPPILHGIVAAAAEPASDLCPPLAHLGDHLLDHDAFLRSNGVMVEVGLEVLVEALSALFRRARLDGC